MGCGDFTFFLKRPFMNLNRRAKVLQRFRLYSGLIGLIWALILLAGSMTTSGLQINRLDCAHVDVSNGLFSMMRDSVNSNVNSPADNYGSGLTASEINLLSVYTEQNVEQCPQFIDSNVFNWCFGNYNATNTNVIDGVTTTSTKYVKQYCTKHDPNYVYDYRGQLKTIGLNIILAYAYDDNSISTTANNDDYIPDHAYLQKLQLRRIMTKAISSLLILAFISDFIILLLGLLMYGSRGYAKDDHNASPTIRQLLPLLSLLSLLAVFVSVGATTLMSVNIRNEIENELGSFGIHSHLGGCWFSMAWCCVAVHIINTCSWGGPVWCGAPNQIKIQDDDDRLSYVGAPSFRQKQFNLHRRHSYEDEESGGASGNPNPFNNQYHTGLGIMEGLPSDQHYEMSHLTSEEPYNNNTKGFFKNKVLKKLISNTDSKPGDENTLVEYEDDDFLGNDIFLTEDDRFIQRRQKLLLNKKLNPEE